MQSYLNYSNYVETYRASHEREKVLSINDWETNMLVKTSIMFKNILASSKRVCFHKGKLHCSEKDPRTGLTLPALIENSGTMWWVKKGKIHRDDKDENGHYLPAMVNEKLGEHAWYFKGKKHRSDKDEAGFTLPAVINTIFKAWFQNGKKTRDEKDSDGLTLPSVIFASGKKVWSKNNKIFRDDKNKDGDVLPTVVHNDGGCSWYENGKLVRTLKANGEEIHVFTKKSRVIIKEDKVTYTKTFGKQFLNQ